ncbi:MAG: hypothetical protein ACFFGP_11135, partial [Promethearchaeota archaeon]
VKQCTDCHKPINFKEFCRDNPSLSEKRAREFWNNQIFSIHCPNCFFNHLEKPFKIRRMYHRYKLRNWMK